MTDTHVTGLSLISAATGRAYTREELWMVVAEAVAFACTIDVEEVTPSVSFGAVGLDSFMMTAILAEIEDVLAIELPLAILERLDDQGLDRVGDIYALLVD